jgi:hypothetical protein
MQIVSKLCIPYLTATYSVKCSESDKLPSCLQERVQFVNAALLLGAFSHSQSGVRILYIPVVGHYVLDVRWTEDGNPTLSGYVE